MEEEIYKATIILIHSLAQINEVCNQFIESPNDDNGDKIIEIIDKCEEKFLKVKEEIVTMVRDVEEKSVETESHEQEIFAIKTECGFLINDKE